MLHRYPIYSVRLARIVDGDTVYDVLAQGAGIPASARVDLFDEMRRVLALNGYRVGPDVTLTVADSIAVAPCTVRALAETFAASVAEAIDADVREAVA